MRNYRRPYKIKKKKSILKNRFFWLAILISAVSIGIFYLVFFHSFFQIKSIEIAGNEKVSAENLESLLNEKTNRKILSFSSASIFLVDFGEINKEILESFPRISETKLKRKFPNALFLQVKEREAVAVFNQEDKSFLVDKDGIVFDFIDSEAEEQIFLKFKKLGGEEVSLRDRIIIKDQLSRLLGAELKLKNDINILAEEVMVVSDVRFDIKTLEGFQIYFSFQEDLDWQLTKLKAVLEEDFPPDERRGLKYIDVRFGPFAVPVLINQ